MGCCVSSHKNKTPPKNNTTLEKNNNTHQFPCVSKSPPRAEEEAVKEVLSETPKPRSRPRSRPESPKKRQAEVVDEKEDVVQAVKPATKMLLVTPNKAFLEQKKTGAGAPYPDPITPEEISEASEMCSFSETISTSTLKEEEDLQHYHHHQFYSSNKDTAASGEARQRVFRSQGYSGNFVQHHHCQPPQQQQQQQQYKSQGRSPARRRPEPDSSPVRKRPPGPAGPRRETPAAADNSFQRSQPPAAMRASVGRTPSARKTGPSPGRVRMAHGPESGKKMQEGEATGDGGRRENEEWQGPKESLENPLVSLECFIFL